MEIINFYKKIGETPLEALGRFKEENPQYGQSRLTYAGRLDPMAEGVLLILIDATEEEKQKVLEMPKTYYFEVLWGIRSDTLDILGKIQSHQKTDFSQLDLSSAIQKLEKLTRMPYPAFSSKPVQGKPLWQWAREERLNEIKIPEREIKIFSLVKIKDYEILGKDLLKTVEEKIKLVSGDFRQEEIISLWQEMLKNSEDKFYISCFRAEVGGGVYVRGMAEFLGKELGSDALCLKIVREKVGNYTQSASWRTIP